MLSQGVPSSGILVITFTNKAAEELKERLGNLLGTNAAKDITTGTFHSVCARILRYVVSTSTARVPSKLYFLAVNERGIPLKLAAGD
jgi:hypothetical protein